MKAFMDENFLLSTDTAQKLYHEYAEPMPIVDYHCHLSPRVLYVYMIYHMYIENVIYYICM